MIYDLYFKLQLFFERGGTVLQAIFWVSLLMWTLIFLKAIYFVVFYPPLRCRVVREWELRVDKSSWYAHQIRKLRISRVNQILRSALPLIQTLVAVCPLLGILGTVTGMVQVFDVMALTGTSDARGMASGISRATLPTMAGLVAAISGVYFSSWLDRQAKVRTEALADLLLVHGTGKKHALNNPDMMGRT